MSFIFRAFRNAAGAGDESSPPRSGNGSGSGSRPSGSGAGSSRPFAAPSSPISSPITDMLAAERHVEEQKAGEVSFSSMISHWKYSFQSDGDFLMIVHFGPRHRAAISISLRSRASLTWPECKTIKKCFEIMERFNNVEFSSFERIVAATLVAEIFVESASRQVIREQGDCVLIQVKPQEQGIGATPGRIKTQKFFENSDQNFVLSVDTDAEAYDFIIVHRVVNNSYSMLQGRCVMDCLTLTEHGDKFDESIFLASCAKLRQKYHAVQVARRPGGGFICKIWPTSLSPQHWGSFSIPSSSVTLPSAAASATEWSPATEARIRRIEAGGVHNGVTCDGCRVKDFPGIRYTCQTCYNYDLCPSCHTSRVATNNHSSSHSMTAKRCQPNGGSAPQAASNGGGARAEDAAIQTLLELLCAGANIDRTNNDSECHYGIICDGCRREDFTGERYKCQICNDYDLCGACFRNGVSSKSHRTDHSMSKMPPRAKPATHVPTNTSLNPFSRERATEEVRARLMSEAGVDAITSCYWDFDSEKNFLFVMQAGKKGGSSGAPLAYIVHVQCSGSVPAGTLHWCESRVIQNCFQFTERFTGISRDTFVDSWPRQLKQLNYIDDVEVGSLRGMAIMKITCKRGSRYATQGLIKTQMLSFNEAVGQFVIDFDTDSDNFQFLVDCTKQGDSFAKQQGSAVRECLSMSEHHNKMDQSIFLKCCAKLRQDHHRVAVHRRASGLLVCHVSPTNVKPLDWTGEPFPFGNVALPAPPGPTEKLDWSNSTKLRIERDRQQGIHPTWACDGCRLSEIHGRAYKCTVCTNFMLCQSCQTKRVSCLNHIPSHAMTAHDPPTLNIHAPVNNDPRLQNNGRGSNNTPLRDKSSLDAALPSYGNGTVYALELFKPSGQANVYRGVKKMTTGAEVEVAIKVYHRVGDWQDAKDEIISLLRIPAHKNVMGVLDFYEVPRPCVVMDFIKGGDLRDYLDANGAMSGTAAFNVIRGIAEGLSHLHKHNIVHRDVKSLNVLLRMPQREAVLIDLGLGKTTDGPESLRTNGMKGTLPWMAPEMMREYAWSTKTDMYALGIIIWEVYSGKIPYADLNIGVLDFCNNVADGNLRPPTQAARTLTTNQAKLMMRLWDGTAAVRPSADDFLSLWEEY